MGCAAVAALRYQPSVSQAPSHFTNSSIHNPDGTRSVPLTAVQSSLGIPKHARHIHWFGAILNIWI